VNPFPHFDTDFFDDPYRFSVAGTQTEANYGQLIKVTQIPEVDILILLTLKENLHMKTSTPKIKNRLAKQVNN